MEHNLANAWQSLGERQRAEAMLMKAIDHQKSALRSRHDLTQAIDFLREHDSTLLRWQTRKRRWDDVKATNIELLHLESEPFQFLQQEPAIRSVVLE